MSFPKILVLLSIVLFGGIFSVSLLKKSRGNQFDVVEETARVPLEVELSDVALDTEEIEVAESDFQQEVMATVEESVAVDVKDLPDADRINALFSVRGAKLPIVQTVTYKSRVAWLPDRPAWIADYSSHYKTSRHFIARSLNGVPDYDKQDVKNGDRFNVFREDKNFEFYLLIDLAASRMWFYYLDNDTNERVLLKTYAVGLGRPDPSSPSGYLTPLGKYALGEKIAIYRPKTRGLYQGETIEMVRVFGTRWIPFGAEIADCTHPAKGFGIHGLPLLPDSDGKLVEHSAALGKYESDGCIRMATRDIEELFSIIITRPTTVEIVKGFHQTKLPGTEAFY